MKRFLKYFAAIVGMAVVVASLGLLIASRRTTEVVVVDEAGVTLADAEVAPQSLSINYASKFTDHGGAVRLPVVPQPICWVVVRKEGYQDSRAGIAEHTKRLVVILKKKPNHSVERTGASRLAQCVFLAQSRLAPAAHADRYCDTRLCAQMR